MTQSPIVSKLEALLARVQTRAAEPRVVARAAAPAPVVVAEPAPAPVLAPAPVHEPEPVAAEAPPVPTVAPSGVETAAPPAPQESAPPPPEPILEPVVEPIAEPAPVAAAAAASLLELDEPAEDLETTQARHVPSRRGVRAPGGVTEPDIVMEVEVAATTADAVVAVPAGPVLEEAAVPPPLESRERMVAAEASPAPAVEVEAVEVVETVEATEIVEAVDAEEEPPSSSPRPVAPPPAERLEEMAFGSAEPQPARHTPPPESGRLPAAPADPDFDAEVTGVREHQSRQPPPAIELVPEATIATLGSGDAVADLAGAPQPSAPTTFLAVLDASLAL